MVLKYPSLTETYHHDVYAAIDPSQPGLDCSQKIVLVTGAGGGIGKAIAIAFARANARGIALLGRTESTLRETQTAIESISGTNVFLAVADIQNRVQVQSAMDATITHFSAVPDVLVNNAGALRGVGSLTDVDIDDFWASFEINTRGPLVVAQAFLRASASHTPDAKRTIINVTSGAGHVPYSPGMAAYGTAKLANAKITEYMHYENPEWNIFNVQPGVIASGLANLKPGSAPDKAELPAGLAVWLATSQEARWFNGKFIWANWDVDELLEKKEEIEEKDLLTMCLKGWTELSVKQLMEISSALRKQRGDLKN